MKGNHIYVRRERPTALAVSIALAVTMLVVYVLTLDAIRPDVVESVSAAPRVTREIEFDRLEGWCVSLGHWDSEDQARAEAVRYTDRGAAGQVCEIDGQWHVLGAMYGTRKQASRVAETMDDDIPAGVVALSAEAVRMRITAPEAQIDLIAAADAQLCSHIQQLNAIARQLDKGEIQPEGALTLCALSASEAGKIGEQLSYIPGVGDNALCASLIGALDRASAQVNEIRSGSQGGSAALSGLIRLAAIDAFLNLRDLQLSLGK